MKTTEALNQDLQPARVFGIDRLSVFSSGGCDLIEGELTRSLP